MSIKVKSGGAYADIVGAFVKQGGTYGAASVFAKVAGAYQSVDGGGEPLRTLVLTYDIATSEMTITTNGAGTLVWMISTATEATAAEIIANTGAVENGTIATLPGTNTAFIDDSGLTPGVQYFFHAVLTSNGTSVISPARSVRVQEAATTTYATINPLTGSPTIYDYTDGDGTWRAYEWTQNGSFEVTAAGDVDYLMVAGGGGGGAWGTFTVGGGGGGAGGLISGAELFLALGSQSITVGAGGLGGRTSGPQRSSTNGADTVALGFTAVGGGRGGARSDPTVVPGGSGLNGSNGGSGGGNGDSNNTAGRQGTAGQGNNGAIGTGANQAGGGGGGAGGAGGTGTAGVIGGAGGAGVQSSITGTARWYAGGGGSSSNGPTSGPGGSGVGGNGGNSSAFDGQNGAANTGSGGGGGGGSSGSGANFIAGNGANGVFIIRVKTA